MQKVIVYGGLLMFLVLSLLGIYYIKDSFKILQVNTSPNWSEMRFHDWHEYTSPNERFKVLLPALPQHLEENVKDPRTNEVRHYDMYVAEKQNGTTFLISLISFPPGSDAQAQKNLVKTFITDMAATNQKNELKEMSPVQYEHQEATFFQIINDQLSINGIAFTKENTLYVLSTVFKKENSNNLEWEFFINSFDAVDQAPATIQP